MSDAIALPLSSIEPHMTLALFQAAVNRQDVASVQQLIEQLDRLSANKCLRQLGEEWGFPTAEANDLQVMSMRDLARVVSGTDRTNTVSQLLARYGPAGVSDQKPTVLE